MFERQVSEYQAKTAEPGCTGVIHVVVKGDTLYEISRRYHVSVSDIMFENPYANIYNLQEGDELCIPVGKPESMK